MSIRGKLLTSSIWSVAGTSVNMLSSFVVFALMARLIRPADFGLVAFAALFIDLSRLLMSGGFADALVQRKAWDDTAASTAFWMNLIGGIVFAGVIAAIAAPLAYTYSSVTLAEVFLALSVSLVIDALRGVHQAKLRREFGYKVLALRNVVGSLVSGIVGVILAFAGFGVWALVANRLVASAMQTIVIVRTVPWRPKLTFSKRESRALFGFGINIVGAGLLGQLNARVAELVVGVILGPVALAFYRVGARALGFLVSLTINPLQTTALSAFARLKDGKAIGNAYVRVTRATALVSFPVFFGAAAVAPDFVIVCFGDQWEASGRIMTLLALVVTPATLLYFIPPALTALGRTRLLLVSNLCSVVLSAITALATVSFGAAAVAAGHSARAHVTTPIALKMLQRGIGLPVARSLRSIVEPGIAAALMAVAVVAVRLYALEDFSPFVRLVICVGLGGILYAALLLTVARRYTAETMLELMPHLPAVLRRPMEAVLSRIRPAARQSDTPPSPEA